MALTSFNVRTACVAAVSILVVGCTATLKLAKDDSAEVLARQTISAPNPAAKGTFAVKYLSLIHI